MENPEELLHTLEEYTKFKPKDIPRELEEYLCFVAKTGDPIYQWGSIKHLLKEKLITVVNEFYESCPAMDIPPCPNVELFNYDTMKSFILEKLDTFTAAPFTVQRICELLTTPRKEYNRIDKFMRALEKNILVVSTVEPGCQKPENGESSIVNGLEAEHLPENSNCSTEINVVEMEESTIWQRNDMQFQTAETVSESRETSSSDDNKENDKDSCSSTESNAEIVVESKEIPVNSTDDEIVENLVSVEININSLPTQAETESVSQPVVSSEILDEVTESEAVCSDESKEHEEPTEENAPTESTAVATIQEDVKQADSTTNSKSPPPEQAPSEESTTTINESREICEIASSENETTTDTDSNQSLPELESVESKEIEENSEDSNSSHTAADTTKGYEPQIEHKEENKEEEISSSDKIVVANTSIDDISDDEAEAEAEGKTEPTIDPTESEKVEKVAENSESVVNSSKDCEEIPMEVDPKEKIDFNEAEAACESN